MTRAFEDTADGGPVAKTSSNAHSHHGHHNHNNNFSQKHQNAVAAAVDYGYPLGHLGFLSKQEAGAFAAFKEALEEQGLYTAGPVPSHDDQTLLRFLRARRWVVPDGVKQFKDTEDWRQANQINVLYNTIDLEAYEQSRRLWTGRRDKRGIPLYLFEIRHLDSQTISAYEKTTNNTYSKAQSDGKTPPRLMRLFALYENLTRFVQPLCTEMPDREHAVTTPITLSTNIVDVSGVSLRQFWNLKGHMQAASTLATAHYPETLDLTRLCPADSQIIGAPIFFSTVWGWVKRWFDPVTVSKIFILSQNEVLPTLLSFIDIQNIPKSYGGELDFNWGEMPNLDATISGQVSWANGFSAFPIGPVYWRPLAGPDGTVDRYECVAVGSEEQVERQVRVCTVPKHFQGPEAEATVVKATAEAQENGTADKTASAEEPEASVGAPDVPVSELEDLGLTEKAVDTAKRDETTAASATT